MIRLSKHVVNKLSAEGLKAKLPFVITSDNEDIAAVIPLHDVNKLMPHNTKHVSTATELRFSKHKQARGRLND